MSARPLLRAVMWGLLGFAVLLAAYFALLTAVSGWAFTVEQFVEFWPYVVALAAGFGIQITLFFNLRELVRGARAHGRVVAASGTASTAAMISCCTHYFANILPLVGAAGLVTLAAQYQVELFWVGLAFNAAGIAYLGSRVVAAAKEHAKCAHPA